MQDTFTQERRKMVKEQIIRRGVRSSRIIKIMELVPRHLFLPEADRSLAYSDFPLPIGYEQTISQPYIVALMTDLLGLNGSERVLEIGTGSGYQSIVLANLCAQVYTVEIIDDLSRRAETLAGMLDVENVHFRIGDGSLGWDEFAPYDRILVTAAAPEVPPPLLEQLADGGRLVLPVGSRGFQELQIWERLGKNWNCEHNIPVAFVPLRGKHGW